MLSPESFDWRAYQKIVTAQLFFSSLTIGMSQPSLSPTSLLVNASHPPFYSIVVKTTFTSSNSVETRAGMLWSFGGARGYYRHGRSGGVVGWRMPSHIFGNQKVNENVTLPACIDGTYGSMQCRQSNRAYFTFMQVNYLER